MNLKRYVLALEIKPENVEDFRQLHLNCMSGKFSGQPKAVLDSGIKENLVFLYKNICIVYIETEFLLNEVLANLNETEAYKMFSAEEAPWMVPAEPSSTFILEKIFDARQMSNGEFDKF